MADFTDNIKIKSKGMQILILGSFFVGMMCIALFVIQGITFFITSESVFLFASTTVQAIVGFIGTASFTAYFVAKKPLKFLGLTRLPSGQSLLIMIVGYMLALPAMNQIIDWNQNIHFPASMSNFENVIRNMEEANAAVANQMLAGTDVGTLIAGILIVGLLTGLAEELLFRGTLQRIIGEKGKMILSIWITALIFSVIHFQFFGFIPRLLLGAWFGYLVWWSKSIWTSVLAHAINNSIVVIFTWASNRGVAVAEFDKLGVSSHGLPWSAIISAIAFVIFICIMRNHKKLP